MLEEVQSAQSSDNGRAELRATPDNYMAHGLHVATTISRACNRAECGAGSPLASAILWEDIRWEQNGWPRGLLNYYAISFHFLFLEISKTTLKQPWSRLNLDAKLCPPPAAAMIVVEDVNAGADSARDGVG